ncbi:SlyX family protein [Bacteriovorax sp. BSW11_IV]|uniref:SlyX family protein n=1 Tax=Bacteriovorax sp. BSW11_IV TaxID=1353529 RepID=UPI00038A235C|nr:SlyX family protein [Bacteriovorax sp. BSW11_IV]EQC49000.1 SlyX family protein [Bacteriovorax sp. BSW11_IV]
MEELEKRLSDLEIKFSFQDEMLSEMSMVIAEQQMVIDHMKNIIRELSEQSTGGAQEGRTLADDKPPHY